MDEVIVIAGADIDGTTIKVITGGTVSGTTWIVED